MIQNCDDHYDDGAGHGRPMDTDHDGTFLRAVLPQPRRTRPDTPSHLSDHSHSSSHFLFLSLSQIWFSFHIMVVLNMSFLFHSHLMSWYCFLTPASPVQILPVIFQITLPFLPPPSFLFLPLSFSSYDMAWTIQMPDTPSHLSDHSPSSYFSFSIFLPLSHIDCNFHCSRPDTPSHLSDHSPLPPSSYFSFSLFLSLCYFFSYWL